MGTAHDIRPRVLVVDDDPDLRALAHAQLCESFDVLQAANGEECVTLARTESPDVILLDMMMPGMDGREVLTLLGGHPATSEIPVIFVSALADTQDKVEGLLQGAIDYITKPTEQREFIARVGVAARTKAHQERLRRAGADPLTGLDDRKSFHARLEQESARARRRRAPLSVLIVDIDGLKELNINHGREMGDVVLQATADTLRHTLRTSDVIFRYGADEFAAILPDTETGTAFLAAERCRRALGAGVLAEAPDITVSIGLSELAPARSTEELVAKAELALFRAKESGGDRCWRSDDPRKQSLNPLALAEGLTQREWSILVHLSDKRTEQDIGRRMGIRPGTVRSHKARIRRKLHVPAERRLTDFVRDNLGEVLARIEPIDVSPSATEATPV